MTSPRFLRRSLTAAGAFATVMLACSGASRAFAQGAAPSRPILRQLYNDLALEVSVAPNGAMHVGAADATSAVAITLLARDVHRWADSAQKVLAARLKRGDSTGNWRAIVEEPGVNSGSLVLSRAIEPSDTTITIFVADGEFNNVRSTVDIAQARAFVAAIRRSALGIERDARAKPPVAAKPPAAKKAVAPKKPQGAIGPSKAAVFPGRARS